MEDVADDLLVIYGGSVQSGGKANQLLQDQDKTRLEFPNVSQATMQKALASLKSELPSSSINITSPNQSLEDYFINIVQKSTAKGSANSGAAAGSGVADYLRDEDQIKETGSRIQDPDNKEEIEPQISQINTDDETILNDDSLILNEKQKEADQTSVDKSSGNADGSSAINSDSNKTEILDSQSQPIHEIRICMTS